MLQNRYFSGKIHLLLLPALLLLAGGCTFSRDLELTEKDSGKTFEVKTGSFITVTLPGNPTTGYRWQYASPVDRAVLGVCREAFLPPAMEDPPVVGRGGHYFYKFEVIAPGKAALDLKYARPWEKNTEPAKRFQVILYCVGKAKNAPDDEDDRPTPRRDQFGNDIPRRTD